MGNKDEKTFTDIFSSLTKESENNQKSFDNIYDKTSSDEALSNENIKEDFISETNLELENIEPKIELEKNSDVSQKPIVESTNVDQNTDFNTIFDNKKENIIVIDNQSLNKEELSLIKEINNNNEIELPSNTATEIQIPNLFKNKDLDKEAFSTKEDSQQQAETPNPFFTESTSLEETTNNETKIEEEPKIETTPDTNPFLNAMNPFLNNQEQPKENNKESVNEENPFFQTGHQEQNIKEDTSSQPIILLDETKNKEEIKDTTPKSTSPFFEEQKKAEENPLFQNQINLIENQAPSTPNTNIDITKSKHYSVKVEKKKEPLIKFIIGVISYAIFIWLLLIGVTLLIYVLDIKIRAAKGDYSAPAFNAYVVLTGSMLPEIQVYDVVVTKKVDAADLKENDVITFASADSRFLGTIITHRIIKKNPPTGNGGYTFQTKGDNNNVADNALVPEKNIYGKVILKIPKLGYLQEFLATDGGWIIVILIPCLTVISYDIVKLLKGLKRKKYKNIKVQK